MLVRIGRKFGVFDDGEQCESIVINQLDRSF